MKTSKYSPPEKHELTTFEWIFVIGVLGLGCSLVIFAFWVSRP